MIPDEIKVYLDELTKPIPPRSPMWWKDYIIPMMAGLARHKFDLSYNQALEYAEIYAKEHRQAGGERERG